jgi:hypothetical protein
LEDTCDELESEVDELKQTIFKKLKAEKQEIERGKGAHDDNIKSILQENNMLMAEVKKVLSSGAVGH